MASAVTIRDLTKSYGRIEALRGVSFDAQRGEIFGIIGPDGAGKTTLFRILTTLLLPDSGRATVDGLDVAADYKQIRRRVGYMPGRFSLYQDMSVEENLRFFATLFGTTIEANYDLIRDIYSQIEPFRTRRAGALSGGMKQKLALSCALIHKPSILFLDEPTTGVDPVSRKELWEMLAKLRCQGITILVSTPYMDDRADPRRPVPRYRHAETHHRKIRRAAVGRIGRPDAGHAENAAPSSADHLSLRVRRHAPRDARRDADRKATGRLPDRGRIPQSADRGDRTGYRRLLHETGPYQ